MIVPDALPYNRNPIMLKLLLPILFLTALSGQTVTELLERRAMTQIRVIEEALPGVVGLAAIDLSTGQVMSYHGDTVFPQASVIKIPIMVQMFRCAREGKFKLEDAVTLAPNEQVGGSGHLAERLRGGPLRLTIRELITAMIETSDNTATNKCIQLIGMRSVNRTLDELGFRRTRLQRIMLDMTAAARGEENVSTPLEMAGLVELLYRGKVIDADASRQMMEILKLPKADFRATVPSAIPVAAKPGAISGVRGEAGVIFLPNRPFVLAVMSTFLTEGSNPVREVTRAVFNYFEKLAASNQFGNRVR
jgi:beta-lactamase class A